MNLTMQLHICLMFTDAANGSMSQAEINATITLLNYLERNVTEGGRAPKQLPMLYVMKRMLHLFTQLLGESNRPEPLFWDEESPSTPVTSRPASILSPPESQKRLCEQLRQSSGPAPLSALDSVEEPPATQVTSRPASIISSESQTRMLEFRRSIDELVCLRRPLYCDIQNLESKNAGRVIKEFSVTCKGGPLAWIVLRPPPDAEPDDEINFFIENSFNGLVWQNGDADLEEVRDVVNKLFTTTELLYIKGHEKAKLLKEVGFGLKSSTIKLLDYWPRLEAMRKTYPHAGCPHHRQLKDKTYACTVRNLHALMAYGNNNPH